MKRFRNGFKSSRSTSDSPVTGAGLISSSGHSVVPTSQPIGACHTSSSGHCAGPTSQPISAGPTSSSGHSAGPTSQPIGAGDLENIQLENSTTDSTSHADDPPSLGVVEVVEFMPPDRRTEDTPLPHDAYIERTERSQQAKKDARSDVLVLLESANNRMLAAKDECYQRKGGTKAPKTGRGYSMPSKLIPSDSQRVIVQWSKGSPIGLWGGRLTRFLASLAKRRDFFNICLNWPEQSYDDLVRCWREINNLLHQAAEEFMAHSQAGLSSSRPLTMQEEDSLIEGVLGGKKKNRYRLRSSEYGYYMQSIESSVAGHGLTRPPESIDSPGIQKVNTKLNAILEKVDRNDKNFQLLLDCMPQEMMEKYRRRLAELDLHTDDGGQDGANDDDGHDGVAH